MVSLMDWVGLSPRFGRLLKASVSAVLGFAMFLAVSRYILSVDFSTSLKILSDLPLWLVVLALALRATAPLIHSTQFYVVLHSSGVLMSFRKTLLGVYASLALEYALPVGGATEVGRVLFLVRGGVDPSIAIQVTFLHRLVHSIFALAVLAVIVALTTRFDILTIWLLVAVCLVNTLNLGIMLSARSIRLGRLLDRVLRKLGTSSTYLLPERIEVLARRRLLLALLLVGLEKLTSVLAGYMLMAYLSPGTGFLEVLVVFDLVLTIFWLLPIVTPAGLGQVELVQLLASTYMGVGRDPAFSAILLYRLITLAAVLPQLIPALLIATTSSK